MSLWRPFPPVENESNVLFQVGKQQIELELH